MKKYLSLFLALALVLGLCAPAFAAVGDTGFSDVSADAWYAQAVDYCRENGLMSGTGADSFSPEGSMTRAMLVTVLYRQAGSPAVTGAPTFTDTTAGTWYSNAVVWAAANGIVQGYGNGLFGTDDPVTREQLATVLYRQAGSPQVEAGDAFADESAISAFALDAVRWAKAKGIINGATGNRFLPKDNATRAQVAQIMMNSAKADQSEPTPTPTPAPSRRPSGGGSSGGRPSGGGSTTPSPTPTPTTTPAPTPTPSPAPTPTPAPAGGGKALVAYFSATGNTEGVAEKIVAALGEDKADLFEIVPQEPYTSADLNYSNDGCRANREQNDPSARPAISGSVEGMENYDVVFLGYPIWWGEAPKIIYTFLESYDFNGKTVVPFCTSGGSGIGNSVSKIRGLAADATWLDGNRFSGSASQAAVQAWVDGLDLDLSDPPAVTVDDGFVEIGGGSFTMGSPNHEPERSSDEVQHQVTVSSFYLSPTEVTQKEYEAVMGHNPSGSKGDSLPVTDVTWYDAIAYCNALSRAKGLTEAYTVDGASVTWNKAADGYRLPTEAEWEYAARANTTTPFHFGDYVHNSDANCYNAYGYNNDASGNWVNGSDSYLRRTVEVTRYSANAYGLYNMHGNVAEWVWDWYGEYDAQANADPTGPASGNAKVVRGGGWNDHPKHIRSAYRGAHPTDVSLYSIGIRLARGASTGEVTSTSNVGETQAPGRVLIAYFSQTGNTDGLARLIHDMSGVDIVRIERATPYSSSSNGPILYGEALDELRAEATPAIKEYPDLDQYDTILLGYCNWWSSIPASVRTLLTENDLSGKTIVPFCSRGGGHFGQTISAIAKLAPGSTIKEGLEVSYSSYDRDEIQAWLTENGIPTK